MSEESLKYIPSKEVVQVAKDLSALRPGIAADEYDSILALTEMKRGLVVASTKRKRPPPPMIKETNPDTAATSKVKRPKVLVVTAATKKDERRKYGVHSTFQEIPKTRIQDAAKTPAEGPIRNNSVQMSVSAFLRQQKLSKFSPQPPQQQQPPPPLLHRNTFPSVGAGRLKSLQPTQYRPHLNTFPSLNVSRRSPRWTPLFHKKQAEPTTVGGMRGSMNKGLPLQISSDLERALTEKK